MGNADIDWCLYKYRHLVESVYARLKQCLGGNRSATDLDMLCLFKYCRSEEPGIGIELNDEVVKRSPNVTVNALK